jgi:uncharacterized protein YfdQ (DUF2303 family)
MTLDQDAITAIANLGTAANGAEQLGLGEYHVVTSLDGQLHTIDLTGDAYRDRPKRKTGTVTVRDVDSFATYWTKHCDDASEIYADRINRTVAGVLDAHGTGAQQTGWRQHRILLALTYSSAFTAWTRNDGQEMSQEAFADFLEENRLDIAEPSAAQMLEVAQSIQAATKVDFSSGFRLTDGQRRISYTETVESKAGQKGELAIPTEIKLRLPIFDGAAVADELTARFRHRINGNQLRLSYRLDRPADVVTAALDGVIADVAETTGSTVLRGTPA